MTLQRCWNDVRSAQACMVWCLLLVGILQLTACGGGGAGIASTIEDVSNSFEGFNSQNERITLQVFKATGSENQANASFDPTRSNIGVFDSVTNTSTNTLLSGSISGANVSITLAQATQGLATTSYSGSFTDSNTITITGGGETLTLRRSGGFAATIDGSPWTGSDQSGASWYVQLSENPAFGQQDSTFRIQGTELWNGVTSKVTGYISVQYVELHIARSSGTIVVTGTFTMQSGSINGNSMNFSGGSSLARGGTPDSQSVIYLAGVSPSALYKVDLLGISQQQISSQNGPDASVIIFKISPDRSKVLYLAAPSAGSSTTDLFLYTVADGSVKQITNLGGVGSNFVWSPDSLSIAFLAGSKLLNLYYQRLLDTQPTLISSSKSAIPLPAWSPDSCQIAYVGDQDTNGLMELYATSICGGLSGKLSGTMPPSANGVVDFAWSPKAQRIGFRSDRITAGKIELSVVDTTSGLISQIPTPLVTSGDVGQFQWSPDGAWLGMAANLSSTSRFDILSARPDGSTPILLSNFVGATAPQSFPDFFSWSPDSSSIAFSFLRANAAVTDLYDSEASGTGGQAISDTSVTAGGAGPPSWSRDSSLLVYWMSGSSPSPDWVVSSVNGSSRIHFNAIGIDVCNLPDSTALWSSDGKYVGQISQPTSAQDPCNVIVTLKDGSSAQSISGSQSQSVEITCFAWLEDSKRVLYLSDDDSLVLQQTGNDLYVGYVGGTAAINLSYFPTTAGQVTYFEALGSDGHCNDLY